MPRSTLTAGPREHEACLRDYRAMLSTLRAETRTTIPSRDPTPQCRRARSLIGRARADAEHSRIGGAGRAAGDGSFLELDDSRANGFQLHGPAVPVKSERPPP